VKNLFFSPNIKSLSNIFLYHSIIFSLFNKNFQLQNLKKLFLYLYLFLLCSVSQANAPITEYILDNGLKIVVHEDSRSPTIMFQLWYKIGSSYEPQGKTGISHMLEHLMYKASNNPELNQTFAHLNTIGARGNALTGRDHSFFYHHLNKKHLILAFQLEAERMRYLSATQTEFDIEKKVILEELQTRITRDPYIPAYQKLFELAFQGQEYHHPVIGYTDDIKRITLEDAKQWHQRHYTPDNATLVISGDAKADEIYTLANQYFGSIRKQHKPIEQKRVRFIPNLKRQSIMPERTEVPMLVVAFKVPSIISAHNTWESYALEVLAGWFDSGSDSYLTRQLIRNKPVASEINISYASNSRLDTLFIIEMIPKPGKEPFQLFQALKKELSYLKRQLEKEIKLVTVKNQMLATEVFERDSLYLQAKIIGESESVGLAWQKSRHYLRNINAVTAKQIKHVLNKYFTERNQFMVLQKGQD
jgi:zinc protease